MNRPWMPLYVGDYIADTAHLSTVEHGAYLLLMMHYWSKSSLPNDDKLLARIAKLTAAQWQKIRPVIQPFFQDGWKHKRIEFELTEAARISAAGRAGGKASGQARKQRPLNDSATTVERPLNDRTNDLATIGEALPSPSQRKEDTADAVSSPPSLPDPYAFEAGTIRLTNKDFSKWQTNFSHLDLRAELTGLAEWASQQGERWFFAVSGALAKRNREVKAARDKPRRTAADQDWKEALI